MIKAKQVFFWASNLKGHGFHSNKATILYLTLKYYLLSVVSEKIYFLKIGSVNQKWPFKCMMLKTLHSNFLDWEDTMETFYVCPRAVKDLLITSCPKNLCFQILSGSF